MACEYHDDVLPGLHGRLPGYGAARCRIVPRWSVVSPGFYPRCHTSMHKQLSFRSSWQKTQRLAAQHFIALLQFFVGSAWEQEATSAVFFDVVPEPAQRFGGGPKHRSEI